MMEEKEYMLLACLAVAAGSFLYGSIWGVIAGMVGAWIVYKRKYDY